MSETSRRRERFVELAESRVTKALDTLRLVGNLSNRANYEYDESDVRQIVRALEDGIADVKRRFKASEKADVTQFKLSKSA